MMWGMWIAHLSDLHLTATGHPLYGRVDTRAAWRLALQRLAALRRRPDLLLLTGDLADDGEFATYLDLKQALVALDMPFYLLPGNHDARAALARAFPESCAAWQDGVARFDLPGGRLLLLDTAVPGEEWGRVDPAQLDRLEACLAGPALLAMHHPPFAVGIPGMDRIACRGEIGRLGECLARSGGVEGLLCGHVHRHVATLFHGVPAQVAPAPAHQIALDADPLAYTLEPGGLLLHDWQPGRQLISHYLPIQPAPVHVYED